MPKIGRASPGESRKGASKGARRKANSQRPKTGARASNWFAAQLRQARLRVLYALRLVAMAAVVIVAGIVAVYAAMGRLDEATTALVDAGQTRLTQAGYIVEWVDVVGANRVSAQEVATLIEAEPGAGLSGLDLEAAKTALESNSWIASADIIRLWPDRVVVKLVEREPYALWQSEGVHRVIDETGVVIEAADPVSFADLPRIVGEGANTRAVEIVSLLDFHTEIAERTTHALFVGERRWSLRLASGGEVLLPETDPASAMVLLSGMHRSRGVLDYDAQILDLRNPGEMVMRPWPDRAAEAAGRGA